MADPSRIAAAVEILKANAEVGPAVRNRVFPFKIPDSFVSQMPKACLVIRPAGAPQAIRSQTSYYSDSRIDVECFGWTDESAYDLATMVKRVLEDQPPTEAAGMLVYWFRCGGGPLSPRYPGVRWPEADPDKQAHWPRSVVSFQILANDSQRLAA